MCCTSTPSAALNVRWMIRKDLPQAMLIERQSYREPWTEDEFLQALRQRNCIGMAAESGENVCGFVLYTLNLGYLEIINLAVQPDYRRLGVGSTMIRRLVRKLELQHRSFIYAKVRETNLSAQRFFAANGFRATKVLRNQYATTNEDAYLFRFSLIESLKQGAAS